jgi:hypothetical protein
VDCQCNEVESEQPTQYNRDTAAGHGSVEEVAGVQEVTVKFQSSYDGSYIIQEISELSII